ncbi:MAG TPA: argininosuccinate lyase [Gaiellaceae bacterium]|nr:argininosuccinate lyase [Gaiellaceae bacterium]
MSPLWSGRVEGDLAAEVWAFLKSEDTDLLPYDVEGTRLHAQRLHDAGLLDDAQLVDVNERLDGIDFDDLEASDEDVHTAIERLLGPVGRKIHAGRSRNDQVVTAHRLYVQDACDEAIAGLRAFAHVVLPRAEAEADSAMPAYTHLQRAIPVTLGHHLLAWSEMLERDVARFAFARAQAEPSPLGAGAVAGSSLELPTVGMPMRNSIDAVADRDFVLNYLYACAGLFVHLSRISEELVLWATSEFGFAKLPEHAATGSSMMPQKLNPDVAELARGKAGTAIGRLTGLLATVKGLPLAYNSDLAEDKQATFRARRDVRLALGALAILVEGLEFDRGRLAAAASDPLLRATDAAEALVEQGVPFRDAHEQVASQVREGTFEAPELRARNFDVAANVKAAKERWS